MKVDSVETRPIATIVVETMGLEPTTPCLQSITALAPCGSTYPQVADERKWLSYRVSFLPASEPTRGQVGRRTDAPTQMAPAPAR